MKCKPPIHKLLFFFLGYYFLLTIPASAQTENTRANDSNTHLVQKSLLSFLKQEWFWVVMIIFLLATVYIIVILRHIQLRKKYVIEKRSNKSTNEIHNKNVRLEETLTNLNALMDHLEGKTRFQQKLIGLLGHDIMIPLQYIAKVANQLVNYGQQLSEETRTAAIREIGNTAAQLMYLGESIIQWIKLQEGDFAPKYRSFNLRTLVEELISLHQSLAYDKRNVIRNEVATGLYYVQEPVIIKIILHNLLLNANKFTSEGMITVGARINDKKLELIVTDSGMGMDNETMTDLNNMMTVSSERGTHNEEGWGLGYRFITELVRFVKGKFLIHSAREKGTQVTVEIPSE